MLLRASKRILVQEFSIRIYSLASLASFDPSEAIEYAALDRNHVGEGEALLIADPFIVNQDNRFYLFYECVDRADKLGRICYSHSDDGKHWSYGGTVFKSSGHYSFPNVMHQDGLYYMLPECSETDCILYRAERFPDQWVAHRTLVEGRLLDASIYCHNGFWYLFGSRDNGALSLFVCDSFDGQYREHPCSPVISDNAQTGRCAGIVFEQDSKIIRPFQDGSRIYGKSVGLAEIVELTPSTYKEKVINMEYLVKGTERWCSGGKHHISYCDESNGKLLVAVDGWRRSIQRDER